jgi:hypothetical protein
MSECVIDAAQIGYPVPAPRSPGLSYPGEMRVTVMVVAMVGGLGCFSTARYDDAHVQRVAIINARYEAESRRQAEQYASVAATLDQLRARLHPISPAGAPDREALRSLDEQARALAQRQAQARDRLAVERLGEIQASAARRTAELATRRAHLQAVAQAVTAQGQGLIRASEPCLGAAGAQLLSRVGACGAGAWAPGRGSSSHSEQPSRGVASPARR